MRLIDADAVIPKGTKVTDDVIAVHSALEKAPTIDAVPEAEYNRLLERHEELRARFMDLDIKFHDMKVAHDRMVAQLDMVYLIFGKR